ncbi:IS110 family transposase [Weissella cibaria]|uniref:IS110 family transposase n=1 Tax=Weissella cibaria TaxID=137591 RepID=UPI001FAA9729|nr:IS110 family transposase [Weissella cibaria]
MIELAKQLPEYEILLSIPSVAENTAVRLIGERGDVRLFEKRSQINSFIGLDLTEIQSGDYVAQRHITKHGNPHARKLLYWTVINMVSSTAQPNHIRDSYEKKRATASRKKPLLVSSMDRLIKTIHYLINTNQFYSYELVHCKTLES